MSPYQKIPSTAALDAHEFRIHRLEESHSDIKSEVTETRVRVEGLDEKMDDQTSKLDRILAGLAGQGDRLTALEGSEKRRKSFSKWVLGVGTTLLVTYLTLRLKLS